MSVSKPRHLLLTSVSSVAILISRVARTEQMEQLLARTSRMIHCFQTVLTRMMCIKFALKHSQNVGELLFPVSFIRSVQYGTRTKYKIAWRRHGHFSMVRHNTVCRIE